MTDERTEGRAPGRCIDNQPGSGKPDTKLYSMAEVAEKLAVFVVTAHDLGNFANRGKIKTVRSEDGRKRCITGAELGRLAYAFETGEMSVSRRKGKTAAAEKKPSAKRATRGAVVPPVSAPPVRQSASFAVPTVLPVGLDVQSAISVCENLAAYFLSLKGLFAEIADRVPGAVRGA
ncbi:hypothetical protein GX586_16015 [bacterium]|nr:hypothetical protein [bacterium]